MSIPKSFRLTKAEQRAIERLAMAGYVMEPNSLKGMTEVGVIRKALRDAWETKFPNEPFPEDE